MSLILNLIILFPFFWKKLLQYKIYELENLYNLQDIFSTATNKGQGYCVT